MRLAASLALVLAAAAGSRQGCGNGRPAAYDPCAAKACGAPCTVCPPGDPGCFETAVVKACDLEHRCVAKVDGICDPAKVDCIGKPPGAECVAAPACAYDTPACGIGVPPGTCDATGTCVCAAPDLCPPVASCAGQACGTRCVMPCSGTGCTPALGWCAGDQCGAMAPPCPSGPPVPSWGCVGKACGDSCGYCPPGQDPATCPVPTFAPTQCDGQLQCVTAGTFTCSPQQACLGKTCGAACDTCPACVGPGPVAEHCDASGACVTGAVSCGP